MELLKTNYSPTPIYYGESLLDMCWGISVKLGNREPALMCRNGRAIEFKNREDAEKYIKEEL